MMFEPAYIKLYQEGELRNRLEAASEILKNCILCPRKCEKNRLEGKKGTCEAGALPMVSSYGPHYSEESCLVGRHGSGTIFMTRCNLLCLFCQNFDISHLGHGSEISIEELAKIIIDVQKMGCHNINFVTPTHFVPQILAALPMAIKNGLNVPLVYNCGGYESVETLKLLDGVFDIYMPDFKYADGEIAQKFSKAKDYPEKAKEAFKEMHRQVGDLIMDKNAIALRGLLVRHLVLPEGMAGTREVMRFLANEISPHTYVNIMKQYRPCYKADDYPPLNRRITISEFKEAINIANEEGLHRFDGII